MECEGVFRLDPETSTLTLLTDVMVFPNGLCFSEDERILYVNDSRRAHTRAFEVGADGMKVDVEGNVYCGGAGGVWVIDPSGKVLGIIVHGKSATTNIAWGDDDWRTLYITSRNELKRVKLNIPGMPVPAA